MGLIWWQVVLTVLAAVSLALCSILVMYYLLAIEPESKQLPRNSFHSLMVNINDNDKLLRYEIKNDTVDDQNRIDLSVDPFVSVTTNTCNITESYTLQLQNLVNGKIKQVEDPCSSTFIEIGNIVCVIKSFQNQKSPILHHGDLIRITNFFIIKPVNDYKQITLSKFYQNDDENSGLQDEKNLICDESIDKNHPYYPYIYCSGILLNTYLEISPNSTNLNLKVNNSNQNYLLKDFPLNIVSLETTVLNSVQEIRRD